uniref:Uncharacterized protein n=1 Tax=Pan troglodytes TaxID=9598 RepID=A0A2I3SF61_PANTR
AGGSSSLRPQVLATQQLCLHMVAHEVGMLAALAALQVVSGDGEGRLRGIQGVLQVLLLGQQQIGLRSQPVHVLQSLAHTARGDLLRPLRQRLGLCGQLLALVPLQLPLRLVAVGEGLVVASIAVLEPHLQLAGGRVGARFADHIVLFAGQLAGRHCLRGPGE